MKKHAEYLIFAGTSEGRKLAEFLQEHQICAEVCVATEYGEKLLAATDYIQVHTGRMTEPEMENYIQERSGAPFQAVIDATHPHAAEVTKNIRTACENTGMRYVRLLRGQIDLSAFSDLVSFPDCESAAEWLEMQNGRIFLTTGMKELPMVAERISDRERLYARVLPQPEIFPLAEELGLSKKQLICMQGPFSKELNVAMLREVQAKFLLTKESGNAGGFAQKAEAAKEAGSVCVVIRRPVQEQGFSLEEIQEKILSVREKLFSPKNEVQEAQGKESCHVEEADTEKGNSLNVSETVEKLSSCKPGKKAATRRKVTLLGIGMGAAENMTVEGVRACNQADCIIGAKRMLNAVEQVLDTEKPMVSMYLSQQIVEYIHSHEEYGNIVIALSGDVGFYSGAKKLVDALPEVEVELLCGISSAVYFASKLHTSWDDMKLMSVHGRRANIIAALSRNEKVFTLASGAESIRQLAAELVTYGFGQVTMSVGTDLSYPQEQITTATPEQFLDYQTEGVSVALLQKQTPDDFVVTHGITDEAFIRGKVPMTKEEVRSISVSKMQLRRDSIVYDIGAGTGSVSIEMARMIPEGSVYAIERKEEAVALIRENQKKFQVPNVQIVHGKAPETMQGLEVPTHAFLGGTGGNMREIITKLRELNPQIRIVINCIALESLAEITVLLQELGIKDAEITAVTIAKSKLLGHYHMMMGQNPVYVIAFGGISGQNDIRLEMTPTSIGGEKQASISGGSLNSG